MAIARCEACGEPKGTKQPYPHCHTPTSISAVPRIPCGAPNCAREALIWLTDAEEDEYRRGLRRFRVLQYRHVQVV
jgi:hypothetical protein